MPAVEEQLQRFHCRRRDRRCQSGDPQRSSAASSTAEDPDRHADGRISTDVDQQAVHRLSLAAEVVIVERQKTDLMELGHRDPVAFQARGEKADQRQQEEEVQRQRQQHGSLDLRSVARQPLLVEGAVRHESEGHAEAAREDRGTLADAGSEERLQAFDYRAKQQSPGECAAEAEAAARDHPEKDAERCSGEDLGEQLAAAMKSAAA